MPRNLQYVLPRCLPRSSKILHDLPRFLPRRLAKFLQDSYKISKLLSPGSTKNQDFSHSLKTTKDFFRHSKLQKHISAKPKTSSLWFSKRISLSSKFLVKLLMNNVKDRIYLSVTIVEMLKVQKMHPRCIIVFLQFNCEDHEWNCVNSDMNASQPTFILRPSVRPFKLTNK